ncbi:hypothetical protein [Streptomyces noursei]|uniref:hypothetical protein n=1 Tax=Streptomyces noursei TaxID=1971 RepID=UPI0021A8A9CE|nr:hypothetical protein [Streptomyces noursei]UWS70192.1 hypothetical protein N1H47_02500 [Streptomyces noursei]
MTDKQSDAQEQAPVEDVPWWATLGPIGGGVLILLGLGLGAFVLLRDSDGSDSWAHLYGAAKVVAFGCVAGGTALLARGAAATRWSRRGLDAEARNRYTGRCQVTTRRDLRAAATVERSRGPRTHRRSVTA